MKKNLAFLLGITPNLAFAAGNVALSLNKYMTNQEYDIVIYYTDLPENDIIAFQKIPHVILKQFQLPKAFVQTMLAKLPQESRFRSPNHLMCFCHFEIFPLLNGYQNVCWLDVDISIQRDLSTITQFVPFGISPDTPWTVGNQFTHPIDGFDMDKAGVCSAVMIANDTLPYMKIYHWLYEKAIQYADRLITADQAIINLMLEHFNIKPSLMPLSEWQCIAWQNKANLARIVHFGNNRKVWSDVNMCNAFPEWYRVYLDWIKLGGTPFDETKVDPHNILGALDHLDQLKQENNHPRPILKKKIYLFGVPFLKIRKRSNKTTYYLFSFLPILKFKE